MRFVRGSSEDRENDAHAAGQNFRPAMARLSCRPVQRRHGSGIAAGGGDPVQRGAGIGSEDDEVLFGPHGATQAGGRLDDGQWGPSAQRHLLESAIGEKADPLPVRREERGARAFRARQWFGLELAQLTYVERTIWTGIDEASPIRRERQGGAVVVGHQALALRDDDGEARE